MPLNINIPIGNFSLGPDSGFFYYVSTDLNALVKIEADGDTVQIYPMRRSTLRNPVTELHWDGSHFWTMEDLPSNLGLVIKRWRLTPEQNAQGLPAGVFPVPAVTDFTWQDEISLITATLIKYSSKAFCVEHYHRTLDFSVGQTEALLRLDSVSNLSAGDTLFIGPSTAGGFIGFGEDALVLSVNTSTRDVTIGKAGGLDNSYTSTDPVSFTKSVYVFNDHTFTGTENRRGSLIRYSWPNKSVITVGGGMRYFNATAADFDGTSIFWVRADQIMEINISNPTQDITSSNESNLRQSDLVTIIEVHDMISDLANNQHIKLQSRETTEDVGTGDTTTTTWDPFYNFQVQPTLPILNSINTFSDTRLVTPFPSSDKIQVTAELRDQFNFPVFNETIQFSAALNSVSDTGTPGTFSPTLGVTNTSGTVSTEYTPSATVDFIFIDITAQVV